MLTPEEAQNDNVRNEIRKVIFHEISQKNVVKFCIVFIAEMVMLDFLFFIISRAENFRM